MCKLYLLFLTIYLVSPAGLRSQAIPFSQGDLVQAANKLMVFGSVLYVAAHPDDENTRLLSFMANELKLRTGYLSLTRGDGGQNLIGNEQGEELGLIRSQELLAARKVDRAEQFFTRAYDFGYSKNPEETFKIWNKEEILSDVVFIIRKFKPDVIITRFPTTGEGGHGHHTASAILAVEAFDAAANPTRFPEQLKHVSVWQAKRLFWNNFMPSRDAATNTDGMLKINVGNYNQSLGISYGEMAARSRSQHKSQGFGVKEQRGDITEHFTQLKGETAKQSPFENIDFSEKRVADLAFKQECEQLISLLQSQKTNEALSLLFSLRKKILNWKDEYWKSVKLNEVNALIQGVTGLVAEFCPATFEARSGEKIKAQFSLIQRSGAPFKLIRWKVGDWYAENVNKALEINKMIDEEKSIQIPENWHISNPYWLNKPVKDGRFSNVSLSVLGAPEISLVPDLSVTLQLGNDTLTIKKTLFYKWVDPVKGELHRPLVIKPKTIAESGQSVLVFNRQDKRKLALRITTSQPNQVMKIKPILPEIWQTDKQVYEVKSDEKGVANLELQFTINPSREIKPNQSADAYFVVQSGNQSDTLMTETLIQYDHIPVQTWYKPMQVKLVYADMISPKARIAYLDGAGDRVAECLEAAGYEVEKLDEKSVFKATLPRYTAIVTGVRMYNTLQNLEKIQPLLMEYVKNGGHLIVQYNTKNWISSVPIQLGPYPFDISRNRVTDENAPVRILQTDHPFFTTPNSISSLDFNGWVQERGLYFPEKIAGEYEQLLEMNDPGESPSSSALLTTTYGKGRYTYMSLSMFRQLPAGVPGAYRLMQNVIQHSQP